MCNNGSLTRQGYVLRDGMAFISKTDHKGHINRTSEAARAHADHTPSLAVRCRPLAGSLGADATRLPV